MEENLRFHRKSIRLKEFDYRSAGSYFVTIAAYHRQTIFGKIIDGEMHRSNFGQIAFDQWFSTSLIRKEVILLEDEFVVMPNHIHGIIHIDIPDINETCLVTEVGAQRRCAPTEDHTINVKPHSLGAIVRGYKSAVTYAINDLRKSRGALVWQRNYYEHIIGTEKEYFQISDYIINNPLAWENDMFYCK
jgi:REP element-mobilizing transposase RayT